MAKKVKLLSLTSIFLIIQLVLFITQNIIATAKDEKTACVLYMLQAYFLPDFKYNFQIYKALASIFLHGGIMHYLFSAFSFAVYGK